jgi:protein-S-isoprenylcysteine O-methyltransferase Ste14
MLRLPPPIWGFIYLVLASVASAAFDWRSIVDLQSIAVGVAVGLMGLTSMFWAVSMFRAADTEINPTSETNKALVIKGPYAFTRNPMYLGITLLSLGIAFGVGSLPMFLVPILIFATANWVHIPFEEAKMRRQFGSAFDDFTHKVRRWI